MLLPTALIAFTSCTSSTDSEGSCGEIVDLFPVPVDELTSAFDGEVDDAFLLVPFDPAFGFPFYGETYDEVFLNTNGGMTFGEGDDEYDVAATDVVTPGIAVFWGDLDAGQYETSVTRANQMGYEACSDRFVVHYQGLQDNDDEEWNNTAEVTLHDDGRIVIEYGTVLSEDILVGVFDGTHTSNTSPALAASYPNFDATSGIILFDDWGGGAVHTGQLTGQTITFAP